MTSAPTAQDVQAYLAAENYLTLEVLASRAATSEQQVRALELARCIPATSYCVGGEMTYTSSFGTYRLPVAETRYYHPDILRWVARALDLLKTMEMEDVAKAVRAKFDEQFDAALQGAEPPWPGGADYAWNYILDGTWGLCLKDVDVASLLTKEQARVTIRKLVRPEADHVLSAEDRLELEAALARFETVALPFAPHEVGDSCRHKELGPAIQKYGLSVPG